MKIDRFDYTLPKALITNYPASPRDSSKLLILNRKTKQIKHDIFYDLPNHLTNNDVLVFNNTKVFPARMFGTKATGGKVEILLLEQKNDNIWTAIHGRKLKPGDKVTINSLKMTILNKKDGLIEVKFNKRGEKLFEEIYKFGRTPLPPYISSNQKEDKLRTQYQTIYAEETGSAAAPTAGLHFTDTLLEDLKEKGVQTEFVTLHVGLDTFAPVIAENLEDHQIHSERFVITKDTAKRINKNKDQDKRIIAVGTTTTRVLESALDATGKLLPQNNSTELFIYPPYQFQLVDTLITNFHLPKSTLLALVSAFVSNPNTDEEFKDFKSSLLGKAYKEAVKKEYRFYSFGDANLIL